MTNHKDPFSAIYHRTNDTNNRLGIFFALWISSLRGFSIEVGVVYIASVQPRRVGGGKLRITLIRPSLQDQICDEEIIMALRSSYET